MRQDPLSQPQQPIPHLAGVLSIDHALGSDDAAVASGRQAHLYLTDCRSLYVAHVGGITDDDMSDHDVDVPAFYDAQEFNCVCWFQLSDLGRVVSNDALAVVEELKKLRNTRYNDRPSIYGGMVDLPLIVTCADGARYFDHSVRAALTGGRFWCEFDLDHLVAHWAPTARGLGLSSTVSSR